MADHGAPAAEDGEKPAKKKGKLLLIAIPILLIGIGAGGWFSGVIPSLIGSKSKVAKVDSSKPVVVAAVAPVYVDIPKSSATSTCQASGQVI